MEKVERNMVEPVQNLDMFHRLRLFLHHAIKAFETEMERYFFQRGLLIMVIGFLLGRAVILSDVTPFALPFFASVFMVKKDKSLLALLAMGGGALTSSSWSFLYIAGSILLFLVLQSIVYKYVDSKLDALPYLVFLSAAIVRLGIIYLTVGEWTSLDLMMTGVEAGLSLVLTMIFLQSMPLLSVRRRKQALRNEEIICFIILLASVMTGTIGWQVYGMAVENVFARYFVLLFAFIGGAAIGSTVGVVTGLIMSLANVTSLYQMSLLAFSGLLGGLLKDGKKLGVGFGLLVGTLLIGLYNQADGSLYTTVMESTAALAFFLLTPQGFITRLARFIPGTVEYTNEQQKYMRKVRDVTVNRVEQFSNLFLTLSNSFTQHSVNRNEEEEEVQEVDYFLSNVTESTCQSCFKKEMCWSKNFNTTYDYMRQIMQETESNSVHANHALIRQWKKHCIKPDKVIDKMEQEYSYYEANKKLKHQVHETRRLVADQLMGVSKVMEDFANEIQRERENHELQEEQILESLESIGIEINNVDIYSLEEGDVDIEISIPYCNGSGESEKIVAPMLSDILEETIIVKKEECAQYPNGFCQVSLGSAKKFVIETGASNVAMGGAWVSGDSYSMIELGSGKYAIAISDGMGNGERAHLESNETLKLLQKILKSGIEEKIAIKSVNSVLALRSTDEIFSTLDLAVIDLQDASSKFLKIGSTPSFVKRGDKVIKIESSNLPMGMFREFDVDMVSEQLKAGDLLIMMSDGIFEGPKDVENVDLWMKRKIRDMETDDPQEVADLLLEEVIRTRHGQISDDMTVVVAKVKRNMPKWAAIPAYKNTVMRGLDEAQ